MIKTQNEPTGKLVKGILSIALAATIGVNSLQLQVVEAKPIERSHQEYNITHHEQYQRAERTERKMASTIITKPPEFQVINGDITTYDLNTPSYLTAKQIDNILIGTKLEGLGWAYKKAEDTYGVNALYLLAHSALESGWGTSAISNTKNNIFGFTAYDASPGQSATSFATKADCILVVAKYIGEHYLQENGKHYNGSTLKGMNIKYASDQEWAYKIASIMNSAQKKVGEV